MVDRIRQERLKQNLSAANLAALAGVSPRLTRYHDERRTPDELVSLDYIKAAGRALFQDENYFMDDYFRWADGDYGKDIDAFIKKQRLTIAAAQKLWGIQEYRLRSWRLQRSRPPREVYEQVKQVVHAGESEPV